jgi:hypothetical protein
VKAWKPTSSSEPEEIDVTPAPIEDQLEPDDGDEAPIIKPDDHPVTRLPRERSRAVFISLLTLTELGQSERRSG